MDAAVSNEYVPIFTKFANTCLQDPEFKRAYKKNVVAPLVNEFLMHTYILIFSVLLVLLFIFLQLGVISAILVVKLL